MLVLLLGMIGNLLFKVEVLIHKDLILFDKFFLKLFFIVLPTGKNHLSFNTI